MDTTSEHPIRVDSPVKAHLTDGSTVVFGKGVTVSDGRVTGEGRKYDITLKNSAPVSSLAIDEVAAMESYQTPVKAGPTAAVSAMAAPVYFMIGLSVALALTF